MANQNGHDHPGLRRRRKVDLDECVEAIEKVLACGDAAVAAAQSAFDNDATEAQIKNAARLAWIQKSRELL